MICHHVANALGLRYGLRGHAPNPNRPLDSHTG
jgi:hypothetical protein